MIEIKPATIKDIDAMQGLLYPAYFKESGFKGLTYNAENTRHMVESYLGNVTFIAWDGDKAVGFGSMVIGRTFYDEIEADCEMFFILPEYRGKGVSRLLVEALTKTAELNGAKVMYSSGQSGISDKNDKLWNNLWSKFGFNYLGTIMVRMTK